MWGRLSLALTVSVVLAGCGAHDDREWMKVNTTYTTEDFQRDHRECSRTGSLDDACMRQRGWVSVNPSNSQPPPPPVDPRGRRY